MTLPANESSRHGDERLVLAIAGGDRHALERLYLGYHRRLTRFVSRFTPRYENVEEIVNDTFMAVWQGAGNFRRASQVSTWIFGIAYRTALNSLRRQKPHAAAEVPLDLAEQMVDPMREAELRDWVTHGLERLPIEQRLTVELAYQMGHSLEEIADITDSPIGTVKARMFYAREKLRRHLPLLGGESTGPVKGDP